MKVIYASAGGSAFVYAYCIPIWVVLFVQLIFRLTNQGVCFPDLQCIKLEIRLNVPLWHYLNVSGIGWEVIIARKEGVVLK